MTRRPLVAWAIVLALLLAPASMRAQKHAPRKGDTHGAQKRAAREARRDADEPAVMWHDPGEVQALDLLDGAGGEAHRPDPNGSYTFVREPSNGVSPKFDVVDGQGVQWRAKLNVTRAHHHEPQAETAATRLMWAAGYFADEDYYLSEITVAGLPSLRRDPEGVDAGGRVHGVRLKRRADGARKVGTWKWEDNPFTGTRELNGLRVMMALLNNWDLKDSNNEIVEVDGERRFLVSDLGASFGRTGNELTRTKGTLEDYAESPFIEHVNADSVDFVMHTRLSPLSFLNLSAYWVHARMELVARDIPRADARWLGQRLAMLSEEQVRDAFRAAGLSPAEVDGYTAAVLKRIAALEAL